MPWKKKAVKVAASAAGKFLKRLAPKIGKAIKPAKKKFTKAPVKGKQKAWKHIYEFKKIWAPDDWGGTTAGEQLVLRTNKMDDVLEHAKFLNGIARAAYHPHDKTYHVWHGSKMHSTMEKAIQRADKRYAGKKSWGLRLDINEADGGVESLEDQIKIYREQERLREKSKN